MNLRLGRVLGALVAPATLLAQDGSMSLDVGSARMRFADSVSASALTVTPAVRAASAHATLDAWGTFSRLGSASSNSGALSASLLTSRVSSFTGELEALGGGSAHSDGTRTGQWLGLGRVHLASGSRGAWLGVGAGRTWDGAWNELLQADGGAWIRTAADVFSISAAPTRVADTIRYTDFFAAAHRELPRWDLDASVGFRAGARVPPLPANHNVWGGLSVSWWFAPAVGVVASAGSYPVDFTQGYPGGRFVSLTLRVRRMFGGGAALDLSSVAAALGSSGGGRFEAIRVPSSADLFRVRLHAPKAHAVEVMGDFTGWTAVALRRDGSGWWSTTAALPPGTHQLNVRIDGGPWGVPAGLLPMRDEFGGVVGLLVVDR